MLQATQFADAKLAHDAVAHPTQTMCYTTTREEQHGMLMAFVYRCFNDRISPVITPMSDAAISQTASAMVKKHLMLPDEAPVEVSVSPKLSPPGGLEGRYTGAPLRPMNSSTNMCPGTGHTLVCANNDNPALANAATLSGRLTSNGLKLMSLHALQHAAERAIVFIDKIEPSLKKAGAA